MTNPIKAKILELVPDVVNEREWSITLAVVLRAIRNAGHGVYGKGSSGGDDKGNWFFINDAKNAWNLSQDNYDQQSEETRAFIGSLLGVK